MMMARKYGAVFGAHQRGSGMASVTVSATTVHASMMGGDCIVKNTTTCSTDRHRRTSRRDQKATDHFKKHLENVFTLYRKGNLSAQPLPPPTSSHVETSSSEPFKDNMSATQETKSGKRRSLLLIGIGFFGNGQSDDDDGFFSQNDNQESTTSWNYERAAWANDDDDDSVNDSCPYSNNGICDECYLCGCSDGTDCTDCGDCSVLEPTNTDEGSTFKWGNFLWSIGKAIIGAVCFVCGAIIAAATFVVKAVQCDDLGCIANAGLSAVLDVVPGKLGDVVGVGTLIGSTVWELGEVAVSERERVTDSSITTACEELYGYSNAKCTDRSFFNIEAHNGLMAFASQDDWLDSEVHSINVEIENIDTGSTRSVTEKLGCSESLYSTSMVGTEFAEDTYCHCLQHSSDSPFVIDNNLVTFEELIAACLAQTGAEYGIVAGEDELTVEKDVTVFLEHINEGLLADRCGANFNLQEAFSHKADDTCYASNDGKCDERIVLNVDDPRMTHMSAEMWDSLQNAKDSHREVTIGPYCDDFTDCTDCDNCKFKIEDVEEVCTINDSCPYSNDGRCDEAPYVRENGQLGLHDEWRLTGDADLSVYRCSEYTDCTDCNPNSCGQIRHCPGVKLNRYGEPVDDFTCDFNDASGCYKPPLQAYGDDACNDRPLAVCSMKFSDQNELFQKLSDPGGTGDCCVLTATTPSYGNSGFTAVSAAATFINMFGLLAVWVATCM